MGSGSSSERERSQNTAPQEAPGPARTATEPRVDAITRVDMGR
jgi:hypothetical protein